MKVVYGGILPRQSRRVPVPGSLLWTTKLPKFKVPNYTNLALIMTFYRGNVCGYDIKLIVAGQI